ncbi:MAG: GNAT family N-acetyltransferase [Candidatus Lokiarchaeota archaeon]|nr:GNAT family N-acetyltransferase [Candidatus Lokiarchaeota archaeon]
MEANFIQIKPYDESLGLSILVDLYNQMSKYLNPETTIELTEELARVVLGKEIDLSQDFLIFESQQGEIIAFAGVSKVPIYKDAWVVIYGVLPDYFKSELPGKLIDTVLELGKKRNAPELLFQTFGELSAPFDKKLENLGFRPVNYNWSMRLDDFDLFSNPGIPEGIKIRTQKEIDDYASFIAVLNEAFQGSFKFAAITEKKWQEIQEALKRDHIVDYCIAYEKDKIVGFCDAYFNPKQDRIGLIGDLSVVPSYQHHKIGSAVLAFGIETLRKKGCTIINLSVDTKNEKALGLYKKFGFYTRDNFTQKTYQII